MAELDNKKMWETIRREAQYFASSLELVGLIDFALKEQGLKWDGKEIVNAEEGPKQNKFHVGACIWKKADHSVRIQITGVDDNFYYAASYNLIIAIADEEWELADPSLEPGDGREPEPFKLEQGKWYVCLEDVYDHVTDDTIFKAGELFKVEAMTPRVRTINDHFRCIEKMFRPATESEIPSCTEQFINDATTSNKKEK